jgi:DNA-binding MarR family transcriptional regulator
MLQNDSRLRSPTQQFEVSGEGMVRESSVREAVSLLKERFTEIDSLALEAHLMLERTHSLLAEMRSTLWANKGLTGRHRFPLLRLLYLADGHRMTMGTIASSLGIGTNNTTQLIEGMVREGLVTRQQDPDDKRVFYAELTSRAEDLFADLFPRNAQRVREAWAPLSAREKSVLVHLLARVRMHLLTVTDEQLELTDD